MARTWLASALLIFIFAVAAPGFAADEGAPPTGERQAPAVFTAMARRPALLSLYVSFAVLNLYDGFSTITAVAHGASEANPLMGGVAGNSVALLAVKAGVTTASIIVAERLWQQHHRTKAIGMMIAANGILMVVAANNASVLREVK